jgi:hypothetical protein
MQLLHCQGLSVWLVQMIQMTKFSNGQNSNTSCVQHTQELFEAEIN